MVDKNERPFTNIPRHHWWKGTPFINILRPSVHVIAQHKTNRAAISSTQHITTPSAEQLKGRGADLALRKTTPHYTALSRYLGRAGLATLLISGGPALRDRFEGLVFVLLWHWVSRRVSKSGFPKSYFTTSQLGDRLLYSVNHLHYPQREVQNAPICIDRLGSKLGHATSCTSNANKSLSRG